MDGLTWQTYEQDLDRKAEDLCSRVHTENIKHCRSAGAIFRGKMAFSEGMSALRSFQLTKARPGLPIGNKLRLEAASLVFRNRNLDLAMVEQHYLGIRIVQK